MVVGKVETGCPLLVLHHVAPRTGGCHRRLVTGTVTAHMLLVVAIQPPCRRSDSPRVQHYHMKTSTSFYTIHSRRVSDINKHTLNMVSTL